jgi:hypothetical protein
MKRSFSPLLLFGLAPVAGGIAAAVPLPMPVRLTLLAALLTIGAAAFGLLAVYEHTRPAQSPPGPAASWALIGVGFGLISAMLWYLTLRWGFRPSLVEIGVGLVLDIGAGGAMMSGIMRLPRAEAAPAQPTA